MARLALEGIRHIPDSAFEKIPVIGPRYFQEDKHQRNSSKSSKSDKMSDRRHRSQSRGSISDDSEDYEASRREQRERRRNRRDQRRSQDRDQSRGYDNEQGAPYFPPPPRIAVDEPMDLESQRPVQGDEPFISRHPQERNPYNPPRPPIGADGLGAPSNYGRSRSAQPHFDTSRSAAAERYRPDDYDPRDSYRRQDSYASQYGDDRGSPSRQYPNELAIRHPNQYQDDYDSEEDDDRGRRNQKRSQSARGSFREKSQASMNRVKDEVVKHKKDIGAGALGALAGGIIGNIVANAASSKGHGSSRHDSKSKQNLGGMIIGAAIGGIGAAAFENKREKKKKEKDDYESHYWWIVMIIDDIWHGGVFEWNANMMWIMA